MDQKQSMEAAEIARLNIKISNLYAKIRDLANDAWELTARAEKAEEELAKLRADQDKS